MPDEKSRYFCICSHLNGLVLGAENATEAAGLQVVMWPRRAQPNDCHLFYEHHSTGTIRCKTNNNCLQSSGKGDRFRLMPYRRGQKDQQWMISQHYIINRVDPGFAMDIISGCRDPGTHLCAWPLHGKPNQSWSIDYVEPQYFVIRSSETQRIMGLRNAEKPRCSEVVMTSETKMTADAQLWWEDRFGVIHAKQDKLTLDAKGRTVVLSPYDSKEMKQQWVITGMYITNRHDKDTVLALDVAMGDNMSDVDITIKAQTANMGKPEQWTFCFV